MVESPAPKEAANQEKLLIPQKYVYLGIAAVVIAFAILITLVILGVKNPEHTETFRDIAIIALAVESGLVGLALLVLIVQVTRLTNMLEFEIKPILESTEDTVGTIRGTAAFMSERLVSPVIKASGYASGIARLAGNVSDLFSGKTPSAAEIDNEEMNDE